jgi:hypothetical protein
MKNATIENFTLRKRPGVGWFRFFVPLDGTALALELRIEPSGQISALRISGQQSETLEEKPRLKQMLIDGADHRVALVNLLLQELDMPWAAVRQFRNNAGAIGAIIEAADARYHEVRAQARDEANDCA